MSTREPRQLATVDDPATVHCASGLEGEATPATRFDLLVASLVAIGLTSIFQFLFFVVAPTLWDAKAKIPLSEVTPWKAKWVGEADGIESPALLMLAPLLVVASIALTRFLLRRGRRVTGFIAVALLAVSVRFIDSTGFRLPFTQPLTLGWRWLLVEAVLLGFAFSLAWLVMRPSRARLGHILLCLVVAPICLVTVVTWRPEEWGYFLSPALQLLDGASPADLYMQYDLLFALLGAAWLKLGIGVEHFEIVSQVSQLAFFGGLFFVALRLFSHRWLAPFFVVSVVVVRLLGVTDYDTSFQIQVSPLRIDLWLVVFACALTKGVHHLSVGIVIGAMLIFVRSMGLTCAAGFIAFVTLDLFLAWWRARRGERPRFAKWKADVRRYAPSLIAIATGFLGGAALLGRFIPPAVSDYQAHGIGFMKVSPQSLYWWIVVGLALLGVVLVHAAAHLNETVRRASFLLVAFVVTNLVYFTGRSHDQNLIHLSGGLFLAFFLLFDLAMVIAEAEPARPLPFMTLLRILPILFLVVVVDAYGGRIIERIGKKAAVLVGVQKRVEPALPAPACDVVSRETGGSQKIFYFSRFDFHLYRSCGHTPPGVVHPLDAHILKATLANEIQRFIGDGYTIVVPVAEEGHYRGSGAQPANGVTESVSGPYRFIRKSSPPPG